LQGVPAALVALGKMYQEGKGVVTDHALAASLYAAASESGFPHAQMHLADMYEHGRGVQKDMKQALQLLRAAADQGHAEAFHRAGSMLEQGIGGQVDFQAAIRSFILARICAPCCIHQHVFFADTSLMVRCLALPIVRCLWAKCSNSAVV
jgi:TPR repeat protein